MAKWLNFLATYLWLVIGLATKQMVPVGAAIVFALLALFWQREEER